MQEMHDVNNIISRINETMILFTINKKKKISVENFNKNLKKIIKQNEIKNEVYQIGKEKN